MRPRRHWPTSGCAILGEAVPRTKPAESTDSISNVPPPGGLYRAGPNPLIISMRGEVLDTACDAHRPIREGVPSGADPNPPCFHTGRFHPGASANTSSRCNSWMQITARLLLVRRHAALDHQCLRPRHRIRRCSQQPLHLRLWDPASPPGVRITRRFPSRSHAGGWRCEYPIVGLLRPLQTSVPCRRSITSSARRTDVCSQLVAVSHSCYEPLDVRLHDPLGRFRPDGRAEFSQRHAR